MLQHHQGLWVQQLTEALLIFQWVEVWRINRTLEAAQRLKNCQQLSGRVANLYLGMIIASVRLLLQINLKVASFLLRKVVGVAKSGHPLILHIHRFLLLHDQTVVVLIQLGDLLLLEFSCWWLNLFLDWSWLKDRGLSRHTSLQLDVTTSIVLVLNVLLQGQKGRVRVWTVFQSHTIVRLICTDKLDVVLERNHRSDVPLERAYLVLSTNTFFFGWGQKDKASRSVTRVTEDLVGRWL